MEKGKSSMLIKVDWVFMAKNTKARIYSAECSENWCNQMRCNKSVRRAWPRLKLVHTDIGPTTGWSIPKDETPCAKFLDAHQKIFKCFPGASRSDVVLVDGRFRVACALSWLLHGGNKDAVVIVHDFLNRPWYNKILEYFDIVESADTLVVLRRKNSVDIDALRCDLDAHKFDFR